MAIHFSTYDYKYLKKEKWYYAPSNKGREIGKDLKEKVESVHDFDEFFYHLNEGGHIAAMHAHRDHRYFCRIDIERFFYRIQRNRVGRALRTIGIASAENYSKWSTVKDPYGEFNYVIPYGFVQSPILATLVLSLSNVGKALRAMPNEIGKSVYMDDITLSADDKDTLESKFNCIIQLLEESHFSVSTPKLRPPQLVIDVFNCDLKQGSAVVQLQRIDKFYSEPKSQQSQEAFEGYCNRVVQGNLP